MSALLDRLSRVQSLLLGTFLALLLLGSGAAVVAGLVVGCGWYDVAATKPHWLITSWLLHTTMINSVKWRAGDIRAPSTFTVDQVRAGFHEYEEHCVMCHGGPGVSRSQWVSGLDPTPPYLIDAARRWSPAELKTIIGSGVKMTAMPAWTLTQSDSKIWSLVAFLERLPDITASQYSAMRASHGRPAQGAIESANSRTTPGRSSKAKS